MDGTLTNGTLATGTLVNWTIAQPEIVLAVIGMAVLMFGVFSRKDATGPATMLVLGGFLLTALLVLTTDGGLGYNGQFVVDAFSSFNKLLILAGAFLALVLSLDFNRLQKIGRFEFPVLMLLSVVGQLVMVSASNMMTLYLGLELQSLALYVLAAFARDDLRSSEAGLKYFVLSGLASGLLLYGISLIYGFSGTMDFAQLRQALADPAHVSAGVIVGVVFVFTGLAFKVSAVPFHMWTPDVYEGAPTPVATFFATAPKVAAMALLLRVMGGTFGSLVVQWQSLIILVSIASMVLGALAAIGQTNIKRLMAYSSIGHMGFALIGLAVGTAAGVRGTLVYMVIYVFMTAGAFACITAMRRDGRAVEKISDLSGLAATDPGLAMALAIFMFSLAGIPVLSGFFAKLYIFLAAVEGGLWALSIIGVLTSVVGAYYYIRVVKVMYFDAPVAPFDPRPASLTFVAGGSALFTTFFFLFPAPFVGAAQAAAKALFG
jgi:NADH-quinone oxidoreductase subunit N